jgi:hypothetical protein
MQVIFEGETFEFEIEAMTLPEATYLKRQKGMTIKGLIEGLQELDPDALAACYWLMLKQSGKVMDINKLPDFPVIKFGEAIAEAFAAESEDEEDPTKEAPEAPSPA